MEYINLYDIYRNVCQRKRNSSSVDAYHKAVKMVESARHILYRPTLTSVKAFRKVENIWREGNKSKTKCLADQFDEAIRSKNYYIEWSPFATDSPDAHNPKQGSVYCAKTTSRPGELKIGFTTMPLTARCKKMSSRHGIEEPFPLFAFRVNMPRELEIYAKKSLREFLVNGCTKRESNEYYKLTAINFARRLVATIKEHDITVTEVTLYLDCPNSNNVKVVLNQLGICISSVT